MLRVHTAKVCKREALWAACLVGSRDKEYDIFSSLLLRERAISFCSGGRKAEAQEPLVTDRTAQLVYSPAPGWGAVFVLYRVPCVNFVSHMFVTLSEPSVIPPLTHTHTHTQVEIHTSSHMHIHISIYTHIEV